MQLKNKIFLFAVTFFSLVALPLNAEETAVNVQAVNPPENSPKESFRLGIFGDNAGTAGCLPIRMVGKSAGPDVDPDLERFVRDIVSAVETRDEMKLQPLFHKRTNTSLAAILESYARMASVVGLPLNVSVYKLWALNTVDGTAKGITCGDEGVVAFPLYGYPLQFGLWLQVLGKGEIGRIYISIVPAEGRWNIGSHHFHQWTHAEKDPGSWVKEAFKAKSEGDAVGAYMRFDLAKKLLAAGKFLEIPASVDAENAREAAMTSEKFQETVRMGASKDDVPFISTLLVVDGVGLLYRLRVPGEISTNDIKSRCKAHVANVKKQPWAKSITGVRCSFLMPKELAEKEGGLGGVYIAFDDIK